MLKKSHIAAALEVDPANITRWARRGMPLYSIDAARAWRLQNIRPRIKPYEPAAGAPERQSGRLYDMEAVVGWIDWVLDEAGPEIVAQLHVECGVPLDRGDLACSCVNSAVAMALAADVPDNDLARLAGPTHEVRGPEAIAATRERIAARVAELQAGAAADD